MVSDGTSRLFSNYRFSFFPSIILSRNGPASIADCNLIKRVYDHAATDPKFSIFPYTFSSYTNPIDFINGRR